MLSTEAVASTLYEALAHFRQQLHSQHQEHESSRPRNGKNRATEADEEVEAQRRLQLEAVENCLSAVPQMASVFSKPPSEKILAPAAQASSCDGPEVVPITLAEEEPYINPFTGLMVYPESKYRPGPSGTQPLSKNPTPHPQPANRERENIWIEELEPRSEPARPFPGTAPNLPQAISLQSPPETSGHDVLFYGYEAPPNYSEISLALEPVEPSRVKEQTNPSTTNSKSWGQILGLRGGKVKKSTAQKIQGKAPGVVELDAGKPPLPQKIPDSAVQPSTADLKPKRATLSVRQNRKAQPRSLIDQSVADPRTVEVFKAFSPIKSVRPSFRTPHSSKTSRFHLLLLSSPRSHRFHLLLHRQT
ncbi:hypothetical protein FN846DRAFT_123936 [Sphaerosporella brunnea]|uniref:Uncharacterized protein n=1 Tax=Sphaerosporella brunnea TaxID=1250544 RepID=A0A5J5ESF2_9PEZI|nr:hypothetical protein FN846DRAFT_123936 [Sphaerosporella brunnea]